MVVVEQEECVQARCQTFNCGWVGEWYSASDEGWDQAYSEQGRHIHDSRQEAPGGFTLHVVYVAAENRVKSLS